MRESTMETIMEKHCFGDPQDNEDSEILTYGDQFLYGLNKMKGLYEDAATVDTVQDTVVLTMLPTLHCQSGLNIFVGEGSIEKGLLYRKSLTKTNQVITGRTLLRLAKDVICNCKKMLALVTDATSPYKDGTYPSGTNWDDYARWCLSAMFNSEQSAERNAVAYRESNEEVRNSDGERTAAPSNKSNTTAATSNAVSNNGDSDDFFDTTSTISADEQQDAEHQHDKDGSIPLPTTNCTTTTKEYDMTHLISTSPADHSLQGGPPSGYFFKGYLAWCLWGHIPVIQGGYKSKLFTVAKENASQGKDGSRRALKRKAAAAAASVGGEENNKKARKNNDEKSGRPVSLCDTTTIPTAASGTPPENGMIGALSRTLNFLKDESTENELQKHALLKITRVRERIGVVMRKYDWLSRKVTLSENGNSNVHTEKLGAYETELEELESQLDVLLQEEAERRGKVLSARASAVADQQEHKQRTLQDHDEQKQRSLRDDGSVSLLSSSSSAGISSPPENKDVCAIAGNTTGPFCNECSIIPANHKCRKCKERYVCDVCCSTKRDLELVWWCETCFAKETPAAQALIRSGHYDSD